MNAYPTKEYDDFIDMFWKKENIRNEMIDNLYEKFIKNYSRAEDYKNKKSFIINMMKSYAESNNWVQKSLKFPYIRNKMFEVEGFEKEIESLLDNFKIVEKFGGSIMLIGQNDKSFSDLYNEFSMKTLKPLFKELPDDASIDRKIKNVLQNQTTLLKDDDNESI